MRYRFIIQKREGIDVNIFQIAFESDNIDLIINKLKNSFSTEIGNRRDLFNEFLLDKKKDF